MLPFRAVGKTIRSASANYKTINMWMLRFPIIAQYYMIAIYGFEPAQNCFL